jgi:tetratricopeptide (TPR) repeat protein
VATTWSLSFREIARELSAQVVFSVCAYCGPERIPRWLFEPARALGVLVPEIADVLTVDAAIGKLLTYSLIDAEPSWLTMHRLVQEVARDGLEDTDAVTFYSLAEQLLLRTFPADPRRLEKISRARALIPNMIDAATNASQLGTETEATAAMLQVAGGFLGWQLELEPAEQLLATALRIQTTVGRDPRVTVSIRAERARIFAEQGDTQTAEAEMQAAIELFDHQVGQQAGMSFLLAELSAIQRRAGRRDDATATAREALRLAENIKDGQPEGLMHALVVLANALLDPKEALRHLERALQLATSSDPHDDHIVGVIRANLASRRGGSGDLEQAVAEAEEAMAQAETAYGPDHPRLADMLLNAATVFRDAGDLEKARETVKRAASIEERAPTNSTRQALSLMTLAQIEQRLGDQDAATETIDRAYGLAKTTDVARAIGVLSARGDIRREAGDLQGADADLSRALKEALSTPGVERNTLGMTYTRLGIVRRLQGRPHEAVQLHRRAVELLSADDSLPVSLMDALNNLGNALDDCQQFAAAITALERARSIAISMFGRQHERVWSIAVNLAHPYLHIGDVQAAKAVLADAQGTSPEEIEVGFDDPTEQGGSGGPSRPG